jgi:hypothetical protein
MRDSKLTPSSANSETDCFLCKNVAKRNVQKTGDFDGQLELFGTPSMGVNL